MRQRYDADVAVFENRASALRRNRNEAGADWGQGKVGIGPSIVVLTQPGHWTLGVLANNVWSVAGSGSRSDVNQFLMQCFINYNLQKGWFIGLAPVITANWEASRGNVWTVPFDGGIGRITKFGAQPVSLRGCVISQPTAALAQRSMGTIALGR